MVSPSANRPAIAKAMAMRWSPKLSMRAPFRCSAPWMVMPSYCSSTSTPMRRRLSATAKMRSVSLTRSSPASRMMVVPLARAAATAMIGSSSMILGMMEPPISMPLRALPRTVTWPVGSPPSVSRTVSVMLAPMRTRMSMMPERVGFNPTFWTVRRAPGCTEAATSQNAALEMSPGTVKSCDSGVCLP